eukprot:scaffold252569_cov51-Attheya_sp.AAC.1
MFLIHKLVDSFSVAVVNVQRMKVPIIWQEEADRMVLEFRRGVKGITIGIIETPLTLGSRMMSPAITAVAPPHQGP